MRDLWVIVLLGWIALIAAKGIPILDDIFKENSEETAFQHYRVLVITALVGMFCASMESMVAATLMPSVVASLGGFKLYPWIADSYLLSSLISAPIFGKLVDLKGFRKVYTLAVVLFLLGSGLSGVAQTMEQLIAFRAIQGAGSAGLITLCITLFGLIFHIEKRAKMQSLVAGVWVISSIVGPTVGAVAVEYFTWRWAFYVNVPIALGILIAIYATDRLPPNHPHERKFDLKGMSLFATGAICMMLALLSFGQRNFGPVQIIESLIAAAALTCFIQHSYRNNDPIIPVRLLHIHVITISAILSFMGGILLFGTINFQPLFIQGVLGFPAWEAGRIVTIIAIGTFSGSLVTGFFLNHWGFRTLAIGGAISLILGLFFFRAAMAAPHIWRFALANFLIGGGLSVVANGSVVAAQAVTPKHHLGAASSLFYFFRLFGGTAGIAMLGGIQLGIFHRDQPDFDTPQQLFNPLAREQLSAEELSPMVSALHDSLEVVLLTCILVACAVLLVSFAMPNQTPKELKTSP